MDISRVLYSDARTACGATYAPDVGLAHRETGDLTLLLNPAPPNIPKPQRHALFAEISRTPTSIPSTRRT